MKSRVKLILVSNQIKVYFITLIKALLFISDYPYRRLKGIAGPKFADADGIQVSLPIPAIKQDCIDRCNKIKECNNIEFRPGENKCYFRSNIISDTAPQKDEIEDSDEDGYTIFKHWKPGINS